MVLTSKASSFSSCPVSACISMMGLSGSTMAGEWLLVVEPSSGWTDSEVLESKPSARQIDKIKCRRAAECKPLFTSPGYLQPWKSATLQQLLPQLPRKEWGIFFTFRYVGHTPVFQNYWLSIFKSYKIWKKEKKNSKHITGRLRWDGGGSTLVPEHCSIHTQRSTWGRAACLCWKSTTTIVLRHHLSPSSLNFKVFNVLWIILWHLFGSLR